MVFVVGRATPASCASPDCGLAVLLPLGLVTLRAARLAARSPRPRSCHAAGALVLRWLFFAEAEHVVGLYYGRR